MKNSRNKFRNKRWKEGIEEEIQKGIQKPI
jgi:hypothetical protein